MRAESRTHFPHSAPRIATHGFCKGPRKRAFSHEPADARRLLHGGRHHGGASKCENVPVARKEPLHAKRVMNRQHLARSPLLVITASAFGS